MRTSIVSAALLALAAGGCVSSLGAVATGDLKQTPPEKVILVGTIHVFVYGADQTARTTIEVTGASEGFQLPPSGDVLWVVDRPAGPSIRLTWLSTLDDALSFGDSGFELAPSDRSARCVYFGDLTVRMHQRVLDAMAENAIGVSFPDGQMTAVDQEAATVARLARVNPTLNALECRNALLGRRAR